MPSVFTLEGHRNLGTLVEYGVLPNRSRHNPGFAGVLGYGLAEMTDSSKRTLAIAGGLGILGLVVWAGTRKKGPLKGLAGHHRRRRRRR